MMTTLVAAIQQAQDAEVVERRYHERLVREWDEVDRLMRTTMMPHMRQATRDDYLGWLLGYVERGGAVGSLSRLAFADVVSRRAGDSWGPGWFVVTSNCVLVPLLGSSRLHLILDRGVRVTGDRGHSDLYWLNRYTTTATHVAVYSDTVPNLTM